MTIGQPDFFNIFDESQSGWIDEVSPHAFSGWLCPNCGQINKKSQYMVNGARFHSPKCSSEMQPVEVVVMPRSGRKRNRRRRVSAAS